jgi:hypothetical protein
VVPAPPSKNSKTKQTHTQGAQRAVVDVYERGLELAGLTGKIEEYLRATTWDPLLGYPLGSVERQESGLPPTDTVFDNENENPIELTTDDCVEPYENVEFADP